MSLVSRLRNQKRQDAARDVVERARAGDQVAMGILAMVRDNAKRGEPTAQQSYRAIERYIKRNPPTGIGAEASDITHPKALQALWAADPSHETIVRALPLVSFWSGAVALSHGPNLTNERIETISQVLPEDQRPTLMQAIVQWKTTPESSPLLKLGRVIGLAKTLQLVRLPATPISLLSPIAAWELGE